MTINNEIVEAAVKTNVSVAEYLEFEKTSDNRHEFIHGNLYEMPGNNRLHTKRRFALERYFDTHLSEPYNFSSESVKVKIQSEEYYTYPDFVITNEPEDSLTYVIEQPVLIAEILSISTRKYDSTDKFIQYSKIDSLKYYLLIEPEKHVVIFYERTPDNDWQSILFTELNETINLPFLSCSISLGDIYK